MTSKSPQNPLYTPQREKAGAQTYEKYEYQYHWALYRIIKGHEEQNEYAVFMELHEDVVFSDPLDSDKAKFEFNQVKTNGKAFTAESLIKLKAEKADESVSESEEPDEKKTKIKAKKSSILGKLISSYSNKPYTKTIAEINLVSANGFNIPLKDSGILLEKISIDDIETSTVEKIEQKLKKEIGCDALPVILQFVIPDLPDKNFQDNIVGAISNLIDKLFPSATYNSTSIYRVLIDELNRKGTVAYDYKLWDELLKKKALTSTTVSKVINEFTQLKNEAVIESSFNAIADELNLRFMQRSNLKKAFDRYKQSRIGTKTVNQIELSEKIQELISIYASKCDEKIVSLIELVVDNWPIKMSKQFIDNEHLRAAIICEYIMRE